MEQINVKDMIGYKSPVTAINKMPNNIGRLVGVKTPKFDDLPNIDKSSKKQQLEDFKLKQDIHVNDEPYEGGDSPKDLRLEKAYSMVEQFVPGYDKAGGRWNRALAWAGSKSHKEKVKRAKRHHLINHGIHQVGNVVKSTRPDIDPNLVDLGAGLAGMGTNAIIDKGSDKYKSLKAKWEAKKKAKEDRKNLLK